MKSLKLLLVFCFVLLLSACEQVKSVQQIVQENNNSSALSSESSNVSSAASSEPEKVSTLKGFEQIKNNKDIARYPSKYLKCNVTFSGYAVRANNSKIYVANDAKLKDDGTELNRLKVENDTLIVTYKPEPYVLQGDHIEVTGTLSAELVNGIVVKTITATKIKILDK